MFQGFDTAIPDVIVIELQVFRDPRGFFLETYHQGRFAESGIAEAFVQDNHSAPAAARRAVCTTSCATCRRRMGIEPNP